MKSVALIPVLLIVAICFGCTSCDSSGGELDERFIGTWQNTIQIEGTDGEVVIVAEISGDSILVRQTFPRMSGIDKIKTIYSADEIEKTSDSEYNFYTTVNGITSRISLRMDVNDRLQMDFCQLTETENKDAEFSSCTEWGTFGRFEE